MLDFTNGQALTRTPRRAPAENPYLEARGLEDMNPYEGGDDFLVQGAMVPADMLRKHYESQTLPSVGPAKTKTNGYSHSYQ